MGNSIDMKELEPIARPLLPIIFVLDTSGSMEGQPISMLNHTMEEVINILGNFAASNPDALLKIGLLQVHSGAHWIQPKGLEEFGDFFYNPLTAGGLTEMGAALRELDNKLSRNAFLVSTTGRCKPIIIFLTDGQPTDDWQGPLKELNNRNKWYQFAIKIGFAVGKEANSTILSQIVGNSEAVIQTSDLATFNLLLQKVAINSAMIGSKSHVTWDDYSSENIVHTSLAETDTENAKTGKDAGIDFEPPEDLDPIPDVWGSDKWVD